MNYRALVESIVALHQESSGQAALAVNRWLILRNWMIGAHLVEFEQKGEDRAKYGAKLLAQLAHDLKHRSVSGSSAEMLGRMRLFYRAFPQLRAQIPSSVMTESGIVLVPPVGPDILSPAMTNSAPGQPRPLVAENILRLSWTHWIELLHLDDPWKRAFYENECLKGNWSVRQLQRQIGSLLYERTALSTDKTAVIDRARQQSTETPSRMADLIRDPYVLEFVGLAERPSYTENELESALLDHLQKFLLELGAGFCFEARQKRITVGNEHDYIDLVFYHRRLRCHLLIDLKVRVFKHGDAGQMNFYLNYWKTNEVGEGDNPPVGLLLCSAKDATKVEYATAGMDQQLFVSRYLVALPSTEQLRSFVEADRAALESVRTARHDAKGEDSP
ncbi:MAG: hypothetical protein JWQ90_20 [Hydrocarboniphaga sp.]|uniref:PDDEXK nuclease domain-containing protein n=1 Tax=Hydrocarboniphaga sp. TaxID=2033016 RepID=UPI00261E7A30|nr:PDDEXK nuclease domain-containing protein [Hydrocarboniphaga sp.]MDB5967570.1 hypothetical protein [Hydrocarboniphaga sp.]